VEKYGRARQTTDDDTIRRMRCACWITKATDTYSEYVILIAFPRQKWLRERASILRYTYSACLAHVYYSEYLKSDVVMVQLSFVVAVVETGRFITVFIKARHWTVSLAS
jgi:hypothetical protein